MQQAATSSNVDNESSVPSTDVSDPALESINDKDRNRSTALPASFDSSTLPKVMPSHEGRTLQREWLTEFAWLRCNQDGTCHCSCCLWASKNNRLSAKNTEGIHKRDGQRKLVVGKIIVKVKVHYVLIIVLHGTKQRPMHYKYVCVANFRTLIATLKCHRCYRLFAMQLKVH